MPFMFEIFGLKVVNWFVRHLEIKGQGNVGVFVPYNHAIREISEAMLVDGALPSDINAVSINLLQGEMTCERLKSSYLGCKEMREIIDSLVLDGVHPEGIGQFTLDVIDETRTTRKTPLLSPYRRMVNLADYSHC